LPHVPQFFGSVDRSTQAPLHTACPTGHWQEPDRQDAPLAQALPHVPQFAVSVCRFTQAPPQTTSPGVGHAQLPEEQTSGAAHALPQPPQFAGSVRRLEQVPPHWTVPAGHAQVPPEHTWLLPVPQLLAVRHSTQVLVLVSQYGFGAPQLASARHCTQVPLTVLQTLPAAHVALEVQDVTHVCVPAAHFCPLPQSALARHWTHVLVAVSQTMPRAQSAVARQPTQMPAVLSHTGLAPAQPALDVQPGTQTCCARSQRLAPPQFALPRHSTHVLETSSQ
jgi:hypothetical protein